MRTDERRPAEAFRARVRRIEQHQPTLVNRLIPADQSPLETTIAYEQVAIEVTAALRSGPDPYLAQVYRFGLLEDFDHLYRFSALSTGSKAGRQQHPAKLHRHPARSAHRGGAPRPPGRPAQALRPAKAAPLTKLHALTLAGEHQTHDYYMNHRPVVRRSVARQLYAEIASIEEQHVTQYESMLDPPESWLEKWLLHEATKSTTTTAASNRRSSAHQGDLGTLYGLRARTPPGRHRCL